MPGSDGDAYAASASGYDSLIEPFARSIRVAGMEMLSPLEGKSVLDIGCGTGSQLRLYREAGCRVFGLDYSAAMVRAARAKLGRAAGIHRGDASRMPFPDQSFDFVTAMLMLHETAPQKRAPILCDATRVVRENGRVLLTDYHFGPVRHLTGRLFQLGGRLVEAIVGGEHYRNYRDFAANGGLPPLFAGAGLRIERERRVFGEAFAIYLLRRTR